MSRFPLTVVNPGAESAIGAEWVNTTGAISRVAAPHSGSFAYSTNDGPWDYHQDVAIPGSEYATIDAGERTVDYTVWMQRNGLWAPLHQAHLIALNGVGTVLQAWTFTNLQDNWERWFLYAALPPLTRTLRLRFSGSTIGGGDHARFDDISLGLNNEDVIVPKYTEYAVTGALPNTQSTPKFLEYAVYGPNKLSTPKYIAYAVTVEIPPPPPPPAEGPEPVVLPPDDCTETGQPSNCCVPDLNRLIELRIGPLNTDDDFRKAFYLVQDRINVIIREFNKLATVTRPNPPSV